MNRRILASACAVLFIIAGSAVTSDAAKKPTPKASAKKAKELEYGNWIGCLRTGDNARTFVLTNVGGPNAPKSRNWKTAFITKKHARFDVVAGDLRLKDKVGKTVQLTGRRDDRTLLPHTVRVIGQTCE